MWEPLGEFSSRYCEFDRWNCAIGDHNRVNCRLTACLSLLLLPLTPNEALSAAVWQLHCPATIKCRRYSAWRRQSPSVLRRHAPFQLFHHHTTVEMDFSYCTDCSHSLCICLSPCLSMTNIDWTEEYTKQWIHCTNKQRDARAWFSIGHSQRITIIINQKKIDYSTISLWMSFIDFLLYGRQNGKY